jgi:hypothetical protein
MSGDTTIGALKRLSYLPERTAVENGTLIGGQEYDDVYFTGGVIDGVTITDAIIGGVDTITFDPTTQTYSQGTLYYDSTNESLTFFNNDPNVAMQIGQEVWIPVTNNTGVSIPNGTAVYISGASGMRGLITPAQANALATLICVGLTTETIANGANGYVTAIGAVRGLDTSAFTAGANVFLSAVTPGALTATAPASPNYRFRVGVVTVADAVNGVITVTPSTGAIGSGTANQMLGMNNAATGQEYKTLAVGTAGTNFAIAHTAGTVTFNLPDASGSNRGAVTTGAQTIAGLKTFSGGINVPDSTFSIQDNGDATKQVRFEASGLSTATVRTLTVQNNSYTIAGTNIAQTISGIQTFSNPIYAPLGTNGTPSIASATQINTGVYWPGASQLGFSAGGTRFMLGTATALTVDVAITAPSIDFGGGALANYVPTTSFTPTIIGTGTAGVGTYTLQTGTYSRIGNMVTFCINLGWSAHTGTGNMQVAGLPIAAAAVPSVTPCAVYQSGLTVGAGLQFAAQVVGSGTNIVLYSNNPAGTAAQLAIDTSVAELRLSGTYFV